MDYPDDKNNRLAKPYHIIYKNIYYYSFSFGGYSSVLKHTRKILDICIEFILKKAACAIYHVVLGFLSFWCYNSMANIRYSWGVVIASLSIYCHIAYLSMSILCNLCPIRYLKDPNELKLSRSQIKSTTHVCKWYTYFMIIIAPEDLQNRCLFQPQRQAHQIITF